INATARYDVTEDFSLQAAFDWYPTRTPVDNMNTLFADPFVTVDLRASYAINDRVSVYGEARNLLDATYASSTLIVDQASPGQAVFLPADGRAFYVGLKTSF